MGERVSPEGGHASPQNCEPEVRPRNVVARRLLENPAFHRSRAAVLGGHVQGRVVPEVSGRAVHVVRNKSRTRRPSVSELKACPSAANHTPCPEGYVQRQEWADRMVKTHKQLKCDGCQRYVIWVPRRRAKEREG